MRLVSGFTDTLNHVVDFVLGGFLGHVHNHGLVLLVCFVAKTKAAIRRSRLAEACLGVP
jgi:hypothetical protein